MLRGRTTQSPASRYVSVPFFAVVQLLLRSTLGLQTVEVRRRPLRPIKTIETNRAEARHAAVSLRNSNNSARVTPDGVGCEQRLISHKTPPWAKAPFPERGQWEPYRQTARSARCASRRPRAHSRGHSNARSGTQRRETMRQRRRSSPGSWLGETGGTHGT